MRTRGLSVTAATLALALSASVQLQAQEVFNVRPFLEAVIPFRPAASGDQTTQTKDATDVQRRQVQKNINRSLEAAARLRAQGKSEAAIHEELIAPQTPTPTGSITGTIYESDGVTPLQGYMSVQAFDRYGRYAGYGYALFTDGAYTIQNVATGDYYVQLNSWGTSDAIPLYYNGVTDWEQATLVHVIDGQQTSGIDFILRRYHGAVAGTVFSADSILLNGGIVAAYDLDGDWVKYGETGSLGNYVIGGLATGSYKLQAGAKGTENMAPNGLKGLKSFESAAIVHVAEPETTRGKDFFLERGGAISCVLVPDEGDSIAVGSWQIMAWGDGTDLFQGLWNYEDGSLAIMGLSTGDYKLSFDNYGGSNYLSGWYDRARDSSDATPIHVSAPETTHVTILLQRGGAIAGAISYLCRAGITVTVYDEEGVEFGESTSDDSGHYVVSSLPPGRYRVRASSVDSYNFFCPDAVDQWYNQAPDAETAALVEVQNADTTRNIDFALHQGSIISCRILGPDGMPVSDGSVALCDLQGVTLRREQIGYEGVCTIGGVSPGQYKLACSPRGPEEYASEWYDGRSSYLDAAVITVAAPGSVHNVVFSLERAGALGGFVTDDAAIRITNSDHHILVMLYDAESGGYGDPPGFIRGGLQREDAAADVQDRAGSK